MNKEPFHCHPTIIIEKAGGFLVAWILILISQTDEIIPVLLSGKTDSKTLQTIAFFLLFMLILPALIAGYQFIIWKKTWISVTGNTLVIERNTLMRKKTAYSISHIANINLEQNLFELLIHTCHIKIDLENATDAESTDITIILSRKKAKELKTLLLSMRKDSPLPTNAENDAKKELSGPYASFGQILTHCVCSLSTAFLFIVILVTAIGYLCFSHPEFSLGELLFEDKQTDFSMKVLTIGIIIISYGYQIMRKVLTYYHFTAFRRENNLMIRYGFFRKQDYTIPVKNIHAVRIVQAPVARLFHLYEAQLVCIGIGDGKEELAQLTLCCKKPLLYEQLSKILPEFMVSSIEDVKRSPLRTLGICLSKFMSGLICFSAAFAVVFSLFTKDTEFLRFLFCILVFAAAILLLSSLLNYVCQGFYIGLRTAVFSTGGFTRTISLIPYENIQHLCIRQNPLASLLHVQHGSAFILASALSREIALPYMETDAVNKLSENMRNCP